MSASRMRARADMRARPLSLVLVTVLVGVIGAVSIAALAGARRTDSAYERYRAASNEPDAVALSCPPGGFLPQVDLAAVRQLPSVESSALVKYAVVSVLATDGTPLMYPSKDALAASVVGLQDPADAAVLRPTLVQGRLPVAADEVAVGYGATQLPKPVIGQTIDLLTVSKQAASSGGFTGSLSDLITTRVRVTGTVLLFGELTDDQGDLWASPAFMAAHTADTFMCDAAVVHLRGGLAGVTSFLGGVYSIKPEAYVLDMRKEATFVSRTTHLSAIVLRLMALLAAIAGAIVLGQFLVRRTSLGAIDTPVLRAVGMTRRQIVWAAALPAVFVAGIGSAIAVAGAIAGSALFPTGVARIAEPDLGIRIDPAALALGVAVIVVITLLSTVIPARSLARAASGPEGAVEYRARARGSAVASWIARLPLPVAAGAGARLALEPGHGRTATPVRSTVVGLSLAVAAMVAAFGFSASMSHFAATPSLAGLDFTFGAGQPFVGSVFQDTAIPVIQADPGLSDLVSGNFQLNVELRGPGGSTQESAWGLQPLKGAPVAPTMLEGRWPKTADEIALGRETLSMLRLSIGDRVRVVVAGTERTLTIVGVPVFPDMGFGAGLGRGAGMTMDTLRTFYPSVTNNLVLGNYAPGADPAAVVRRLNDQVLNQLDATANASDVHRLGPTVQSTVDSGSLPLRLSLLFVFGAFATLVHVLLTSIRRRRRDLAILQTLGFRRRQVAATITWQSLILASTTLVFGVPLGILVGRLGWSAFAYRLGVVNEPVISPLSVIVIPVTLVVALVISLGPGLVARRVKPAAVLQAE